MTKEELIADDPIYAKVFADAEADAEADGWTWVPHPMIDGYLQKNDQHGIRTAFNDGSYSYELNTGQSIGGMESANLSDEDCADNLANAYEYCDKLEAPCTNPPL